MPHTIHFFLIIWVLTLQNLSIAIKINLNIKNHVGIYSILRDSETDIKRLCVIRIRFVFFNIFFVRIMLFTVYVILWKKKFIYIFCCLSSCVTNSELFMKNCFIRFIHLVIELCTFSIEWMMILCKLTIITKY